MHNYSVDDQLRIEKASIIKAADILDNYHYYLNLNHPIGIEYCKNNALSFVKYFNSAYRDKIFTKLFEEVMMSVLQNSVRLKIYMKKYHSKYTRSQDL